MALTEERKAELRAYAAGPGLSEQRKAELRLWAGQGPTDPDAIRQDFQQRITQLNLELSDLRKQYQDEVGITSPKIPAGIEEPFDRSGDLGPGGSLAMRTGGTQLSTRAQQLNAKIAEKELAADQLRAGLDQNDPNQLRATWQGLTAMAQRPSLARRKLPIFIGQIVGGPLGALAGAGIGAIAYAQQSSYIKRAADKVVAGQPIDDDEEAALLGRALQQSRNPNFGYLTGSLVGNILPYAVGFAARNTIAGKPFINALRQTGPGQAWAKLAAKSKFLSFTGRVGETFMAGGVMAALDPDAVGMVIDRMTPTFSLSESPDGQKIALELARMGEPWFKATAKVAGLQTLEYATEQFSDLGAPLGDAFFNLGSKIAPAGSKGMKRALGATVRGMAGLLLGKFGSKTRVARFLSSASFGGVLPETAEEFWNAVGGEAIGEKGSLQNFLSTMPAMMLSFAVYGGAGTLSSMRSTARAENAIRGTIYLTGASGVTVEERQIEPTITPDGIRKKAQNDIATLNSHTEPGGRGLLDDEETELGFLRGNLDNPEALDSTTACPWMSKPNPRNGGTSHSLGPTGSHCTHRTANRSARGSATRMRQSSSRAWPGT